MEGELDALRRIDRDDVARRSQAAVRVRIGHCRARLPRGLDACPVEVLLGEVRIRDRVPHVGDVAPDVGLVDVGRCIHSCSSLLDGVLDRRDPFDAVLGEPADPPIVDEPDRDRVEVVVLRPTSPFRREESGVLEDAEVVHHSLARHRGEVGAQLAEGLAVTLEEGIEQQPSARIIDGGEHLVHAGMIGKCLLTCQGWCSVSSRAVTCSRDAVISSSRAWWSTRSRSLM